jgi:glycine hydroxymethyltransferase
VIGKIIALVEGHEKWRAQESLNLIPSENVMSQTVRSLLSSDLGHRYTSVDKFYMGTRFLDEIQVHGEELAKRLFGVEAADLRPLSGHIADLIVLASLTKPKNRVLCVSAKDGGYPGIWRQGLPRFLQLRVEGFPFSEKNMNIDLESAKKTITSKKPNIVIFGASLFLFPHPVRELSEAAREVGAQVAYDGSHVLGLIAGKQFQDPIREGASVLFGSTHKSFFGPQGGIILANEENGAVIKKRVFPALVDNAHWNRIAALTLALAEMEKFGQKYATQVVKNAQTLAKTLAECGLPVACSSLGFTKSHQVYLNYGGFGNGRTVAKKLEKANIITDCGVRLGTSEMTRRGMKQAEMRKIAEFITRVIKDHEQPVKVKSEVTKFVEEFQEIEYCFK